MTEVIMPKMGDGMEEGTLVEWLKKEGEKVKSGEVIGTIQTDKATLELEAPGTGALSGFLIKPGDTVPVGKPIAALLKDGEKLPEGWGNGSSVASTASSSPAAAPTPAAETQAVAETPSNGSSEAPTEGRIKASPLARKIAAEKGIDLSAVQGSGPGGRIVEKDLKEAKPASQPLPVPTPVVAAAEDQVVQLNRLRQITAQRTAQSKQQVPHFYVTVEVDLEKIIALREMFEEEESGKVSINDFVVKACALALQEMPVVNSVFQGTTLVQHGAINIGLAVALDEGLTVAVIKNAQAMGLRQISAKVKDLVGKARENKLSMDELTGSTFSISNMGMLDVDNFVAIINQPNAAILAIASARKVVVPKDDDSVEIRTRMNITASFDHRVVDGAVGARFVNVVRKYLENPTKLIS